MKQFHLCLFQFIRKIRPQTLLDVGCGEGYTTILIKKEFPELQVEGFEHDEDTVKKANSIHKELDVKKGDITNIEKENNSFDLVLSSEVLEHLKNPEIAIKECKRVSKQYCIFTVPNEPFFRLANLARLRYISKLGNPPGHINHWTKSQFSYILRKEFESVTIKTSFVWTVALCKK
ncbi:class I SAM-dependent methyltransferase [Nanoarchaeota archaeon]